MKKIGVITYHAAYNYGSVLQAYALQQALIKLGYDTEIINYRMKGQKQYYSLYRTSYGVKIFLKDLQQLPIHSKRKERAKKFESFIDSKLVLSEEFSNPSENVEISKRYDYLVSGSDQIWNKHSNELWNADWMYMKPYLFSGCKGHKISYASSIGNMTDDELRTIEYDVKQFAHVSLREQSAAEKIKKLFRMNTDTVPDPTFLLTKEEWLDVICDIPKRKEKFFFFYSLHGVKMMQEWKPCIEKLCTETGYKAVVVTPFIYRKFANKNIENHPEFGPFDFLAAIRDCEFVLTDSYHGTALSLNMGKLFYSIVTEAGTEYRKSDMLKWIGVESQIVKNPNDMFRKDNVENLREKMHKIKGIRTVGETYLKDVFEKLKERDENVQFS